jgi:diguanylate cyclase (GGDEF)-like protein
MAAMNALPAAKLAVETPRDSSLAERLEIVTRVARRLFRVPIVTLSLRHGGRLRLVACQGVPVTAVGSENAFDAATMASAGPVVLRDARVDARFAQHTWVSGKPYIRFYAGTLIVGPDGSKAGVLGVADREAAALAEGDLMLLRDLGKLVETELAVMALSKSRAVLVEQGERLRRRALVDTRTQLWNRHAMFELLDREFHRARRERENVAVILAEIDQYAALDGAPGSTTVTDAVLTEVSHRIKGVVRRSDTCARFAPNEFLIFLSRCDLANAERLADRMRHQVRRTPVATPRGDLPLTITVGVAAATADSDWNPDTLVRAAEEAMDEARTAGDDRLVSRSL